MELGLGVRFNHYTIYNWAFYNCETTSTCASHTLKVVDLQKQLGLRIRKLRIKKGYTQESFADALGLHRNFMGSIERGEQNLTLKTLHHVAQGLGTTMAKLLSGLD